MISPESGKSSPAIDRSSVVFPAPLAPINATISPEDRVRVTPFRASILRPCSVRRSLISSMDGGFSQVRFDHRGVLLNFIRAGIRDLGAVIQNHDPVAKVHHHAHLVLDQKERRPLGMDLAD